MREWNRPYDSYADFYVDAYGPHLTELRPLKSAGAIMLQAGQAAGDWSDAPVPDLVILTNPACRVGATLDMGAGRFRGVMERN
ncbi:MAG TPA: hypothetical protein VEZ41_16465, partial [Allosphingosinicella sp.]|nr:hypothetical protein [Allosphingosinicella sp.]